MIELSKRQTHPSDEELLLVADRECSPRRAAKVREHLAQCEACHNRMADLETTLSSFISLHEQVVLSQPQASDASRRTLKAQLAEVSSHTRTKAGRLWPTRTSWARQLAGACIALLLVAGSLWLARDFVLPLDQNSSAELASALPRPRLTPGATKAVRLDELCRNDDLADDPPVNIALEQKVLAEYGVPVAARQGYQMDYLITPELGGSDDIRNLWPEPYAATSWNAHVKDALEDHLHDMVCQGKMPLATAQEEIAADWIVAYKREFHTETPLTHAATLASSARRQAVHPLSEIAAMTVPVL